MWVRWLDQRLAVLPEWSTAVRRVIGAVVVVMPLLFVGSVLWVHELDPAPVRPVLWVTYTWGAVALCTTLGVAGLTVLSAPLRLLGRRGPAARRRLHRTGAPLVVLGALAVTSYGLVEAAGIDAVEREVSVPGLPAGWDGARVVLVTDLHVGPLHGADRTREVVELVNAQRPDLVLLGGDLVDGRERWVGPALDPLADLSAPQGVFAVGGNHEVISGDLDAYVARWRRLGITPLLDESVELRRGGEVVHLAGVQDREGTGAAAPDPDAALAGVPEDETTFLLVHQPRQVVADRGVDLQLSGHTHGGQLWPLGHLVEVQQPALSGLDVVDGVPLLTSPGAGTWGPPVRVGAPPEVSVLTVRATS